MTTLDRRLARWAAERPDAVAFTFLRRGERAERQLTYCELDRSALRIAAQLTAAGLRGRAVALIYPPGLEFIEAFCGCLYAGAIPAALPLPATARAAGRCAVICRAADFAAILTVSGELEAPALEPVRAAVPAARWVASDEAPHTSDGVHVEVEGDDSAFLQFTSGSTREPRGVLISHANLTANQQMIAEAFGYREDECAVGWLPLHHDMGLIGTVLQPIHLGARSVLMSPQSFLQKPIRWLNAISAYRGTSSGGPDFGYAQCLDRIAPADCAGLDLSSWKVAFCGAEPVRPGTLRRFAYRFGVNGFDAAALFPCYGMAEATLFVTGGPCGSGLRVAKAANGRDVASCGEGAGEQAITIVHPERRVPMPDGQAGEIWLRGPHIAQGYRNDHEATARVFGARLAGGEIPHLRTGDIGFMQGNELVVTGRLTDLLIVRGVNIHPEDIEETVRGSDPALAGSACAAFASDEEEQEIAVVIELARKSAAAGSAGLARAAAAAVVAEHGFAPSMVLMVEPGVIPRTTSGKVRRRACRDAYLEGRLVQVEVCAP